MTPLYLTSTYVQDALGKNKGYEYARGKNPTREALERNVAALEGGRHGFAFASGMGCPDSIMKLFRSGDHIVCGENVYGGTSGCSIGFSSTWGCVSPTSTRAIPSVSPTR
jgi:cystathionine beta-lyase/cystathionine gamma-synthase